MKARIIDFSISFTGKQRLTIELDSDFREGYERLKSVDLDVRLNKWREHRSKNANAYFHVLVAEIAQVLGLSNDEVKRRLVVDYGVVARDAENNKIGFKLPASADVDAIYPYTQLIKTVEENGHIFKCYLVYKRSSDMDTKEMSRLIEGTIAEAKELGIDTDTPDARINFLNLERNSQK